MEQNHTDGRGLLVCQESNQPNARAGRWHNAQTSPRECQSRKRNAADGDGEYSKKPRHHAAAATAASLAPNTSERIDDRLNLKVSNAEAR